MYLLDHGQRVHWYPTRNTCQHGQGIHLIVFHTAENLPDFNPPDTGAEAIARYGATTDRSVSWHSTVDSDSIIPMLPDDHTAWHVRDYNRCSLGVEMATKAAEWVNTPPSWRLDILENCARVVADWSKAHAIPLRKLSKQEADQGLKGLIFHSDLDPTRRSDPGPAFPLYYVIQEAQKLLTGTPVMGAAKATLGQAQAFTDARTANAAYDSQTVRHIVSEVYRISQDEGVRADLALGLMLKETGNFTYGGLVAAGQLNFGGIGATGSGEVGESFDTVTQGVHAVVRRMRMYAEGTQALHDVAILGRPLKPEHWGKYPNIEDFNGVWAVPGVGYGESIVGRADEMARLPTTHTPFTDEQVAWLDGRYERSA